MVVAGPAISAPILCYLSAARNYGIIIHEIMPRGTSIAVSPSDDGGWWCQHHVAISSSYPRHGVAFVGGVPLPFLGEIRVGKLLLVSNYSGLCVLYYWGEASIPLAIVLPPKTIFHVELRKLSGFLHLLLRLVPRSSFLCCNFGFLSSSSSSTSFSTTKISQSAHNYVRKDSGRT